MSCFLKLQLYYVYFTWLKKQTICLNINFNISLSLLSCMIRCNLILHPEKHFFDSARSHILSRPITRRSTFAILPSRRSTTTRRDADSNAGRETLKNSLAADRYAIKDGTARSWTNIWSNLSSVHEDVSIIHSSRRSAAIRSPEAFRGNW